MNSSYTPPATEMVARMMIQHSFSYGGIEYPLYEWQKETLDKWIPKGEGIGSATTGAGKTRLAHAAMAHWLEENPKGRVTIIVPSIPLLDQWNKNLTPIFHDHVIGLKGGGHNEWEPTINIVVMATASKFLHNKTDLGEAHFVIVDECHRLGAKQYRKALTCVKHATLGLSATPEREDTGLEVIEPLLGPIIIKYRYEDALRDGVIPSFTLKAVQAELLPKERADYDRLQFQMRNLTKRLSSKYGNGGNLVAKCQALLAKGVADSDIGTFLRVIREQKELLNSAQNRFSVLDILLNQHAMKGKKTMVFHESVPEIGNLVKRYSFMNPLEYHYKVGTKKKKMQILDDFKHGKSTLLFSCRALTEGFNIPDAEVGIMVSGTRSVRSRIQTIGRLLRGDKATVYLIYVPDTKDTRSISNLIGAGGLPKENIEYWRFDKDTGNLAEIEEGKQSSIKVMMNEEYEKSQQYRPTHGRLECKHCGRGHKKAKSKPFKTLNGLNHHIDRSCKDARKSIFRCCLCQKAYKDEANRNACLERCVINPPCVGRMTFDELMDGFKNRDRLHDID